MNRFNGLRKSIAVFFLVFVSCNCLSIGTVSEGEHAKMDVRKRAASGEFFPDWVPFKNKKGEQLGEYVQVRKAKPKKRLALPANFVLKAVAEPQGDDYYGQGQGESESEDYYEKKEWSDINRPADEVSKGAVKHTELSDIDGVVNIITQQPGRKSSKIRVKAKTSEEESNKLSNSQKTDEIKKLDEVKEPNEINEEEERKVIPENVRLNDIAEAVREEQKEESSDENNSRENKNDNPNESDSQITKKQEPEENDYDEKPPEKPKPQLTEEERREQEERRAKILDSVDKLKERHANEQRLLSEKLKEEELFVEEAERDHLNTNERHDKYGQTMKHRPIDYDDYDDHISVEDKYKIRTFERTTTTTTPAPTKSPRRKKQRRTEKPKQQYENGKLSVFKHPSAYMIYDYDDSKTTTAVPEPESLHSFENLTSFDKSINDNARISLVPEDNDGKQGEPTLFFVKKRKNRRRKQKSTTARPLDSYVAETVTEKAETDLTANSVTGFDSSPSATGISSPSVANTTAEESPLSVTSASTEITAPSSFGSAPSSFVTAPSAHESQKPISEDTTGVTGSAEVTSPGGLAVQSVKESTTAVSAPSALASDTLPAPSEHKKEAPKHENFEHEKAGKKEHHSEHEETHEEHGKKAYEGVHKDSKTKKGHHDKEDHHGEYNDHGGVDKSHHDEKNHFGTHHHEEHGKKHAKYEESGKHSKGHSTKGSHDIHKKEEYEKKVEFFEEEGDSGEEEKHGGHTHERSHESGGHFKKDNLQAGFYGQHKGDTGEFAKGGHGYGHKGHKSAAGHDRHGKHGGSSFHHGAKDAGKKWIYHHGHPPKTANLVVIDRRADNYYHGPHYFG